MEDVKLFYDSKGINNYICVTAEEELSRYQVKMLECNEIPGLLSLHGTMMNGVCKLHYDITKMQRLSDVLGSEIKGNQAKQLLFDILKALLTAEDYLLSFNRCVLHPDYIYIKPNQEAGLVYVPYAGKEITSIDDVRLFYQNLLVEYLTDDNDMYFLSLLKYVNKQGFSLAGLLERLEQGLEGASAIQQTSSYQTAPPVNQIPEPVKEEKPASKPFFDFSSKKEEVKKTGKPAKPVKTEKVDASADLSGLGFMVPGMENKPVEKEEKQDTTVKNKEVVKEETKPKNKKTFTLFGGKKNAETDTKNSGKKQEQQKNASIPQGREYTTSEQTAGAGTGGWTGTIMLESTSPATELLGVQTTTKLIHNGGSISISHFPFKIGNGKVEVDYVIPKGVISRNHATIHNSQGKYYIKDENSANHTYLNGRLLPPYTEMELHNNDVIKLANEELIFQE